ncbi:MAG TPA: ubiquinone/menaquinone biosynthesis methyltransferase [Gemmatimonadales bacterium]|jgi:demethylmenaquinone methyltransferase/2-methoxy-6-polyprenyl-1,4-benzoquinol methylase|nr:ubiquinone/menaquinone biosynthesis methyltransferase [Gemmatimonadales bacterium]
MFASERELPVGGGAEKRRYVREMFDAIAPTYDRLNRIISLRLDLRWRRQALRMLDWEREPEGEYLDLCAGTMDFAVALSRERGFRGHITSADFVPRMLEFGRGKTTRAVPVAADALELPFPTGTFDGAMVGWGVRNLADLDSGLREAARVLKPGARFVILEMSTPPRQPLRGMYLAYFEHVLPAVGRLVSKHRTAYTWLPESARAFPDPDALARRMEAAGFAGVTYRRFMGGVTAVHTGTRDAGLATRDP